MLLSSKLKSAEGSYTIRIAISRALLPVLIAALLASANVANAANETILVAANRYVILDDWRTGGALGPGFSNPGGNHTSQNSFTGNNTKINATALFINDAGSPLNNRIITFNLYMPNGTELAAARINATTDAYGLANFSFDLDQRNYYGNWTVRASNGSANDSTGFIYNWWGCGISGCNSGHPTDNPSGTQPKNSPYLNGRESPSWSNHNTLVCTYCHQSFDGKPGSNSNTDGANHTLYTQDVHRNLSCDNPNCHQPVSTHNTNAVIGSCYNATVCHTPANRSDISNKSTLNNSNKTIAHSEYSENNGTDFNGTFHTPSSTVPCIVCHGPMHNITKPDASLRFIRNSNTEDSQCTACHSSYNKHNGSVNCTLCHSDDVHKIQVFSENAGTFVNATGPTSPPRGNCTNCHQNASFVNALKWNQTTNPRGGNYTGNPPDIIPDPLKHSSNPQNGSLWNTTPYWTSENQSCYYCHGDTLHNGSAFGKILNLLNPNNTRNGTLATSDWCADCHYNDAINTNYKGSLWSPVPPLITVNNTAKGGWEQHSSYVSGGYSDSICQSCHALNGTSYLATSLNYSHSLNVGQAGGPNCITCHDIGGSATGKLVNFSAMNDSGAVHKNLNSGAASPSGYPAANFKCWACHGDGTEPASGHPAGYKTPDNCTDCHVPGAGQNRNYIPNSTLQNVTEHYWNGTDIDTAAATSCYACHNVSEMMIPAGDPDSGTGAVYGGANGGNNSTSHYGKKRIDYPAQGTNDYCNRCHNNQTTIFPFSDNNNKSIANHSALYPGTNPDCADCHATGRLHNSTLVKSIITLQNSSYCLGCHGTAGNATTKNLERHNGSAGLNCTQCHLNSTRSIHPVRYLQRDGINWSQSRISAVNCTNCHTRTVAGFERAPVIPATLKHSSNLSNGSLWNSTPYWISSEGSCYYCHNDTMHNSTPLGPINVLRLIDANNTKNGSLTKTTWCADCHYNEPSNPGYRGNMWSPVPPLITSNNTGKTNWENHSGYLGGGYTDNNCSVCHALNGTYPATSLNYSHSLDRGVNGGPNCIACHNTGGSAGQGRLVNFTAANQTGAAHRNLNNNTDAGILPPENRKCWGCHQSDGTIPSGHPDLKDNTTLTGGSTAYRCQDCHIAGGIASTGQPSMYQNATKVLKHYPGKAFAGAMIHSTNFTEGSCQVCHNNSAIYNNIAANINATVSHYTDKNNLMLTANSSSCAGCHNGITTYGVPKQLLNPATHSMGGACQASCHNPFYYNTTQINPVDLHNASSGIRYTCYVLDCHVASAR